MDLICTFNRTEPVRIYAEGGNLHHPDLAIIDNIAATVLFQNGSIASVIQGDSGTTPYLSKFSFQLMDGVKTVHIYDRLKTGSFFDGNVVHIHHDSDEYGFLEENREFISALQRGVPVSPNHRDGLRATLLVLKAFEAIKTGVPQEVKL
jgi:predicted dehydrogenase